MFKQHTICRACGHFSLTPVFDLGMQPLANNFIPPNGEHRGYAPLEVLFCEECTLAQLSVVVRPDILYSEYPYITSKSETMKRHFRDLWAALKEECSPKNVMEIGSNDGEFLKFALTNGAERIIGVDPADNLASQATRDGITTIHGTFDAYNAEILSGSMPGPDLVIARHVFAHIDDWSQFVKNLSIVCGRETLVAIEVPLQSAMLEQCWFDQIYHEHLSYVSDKALHRLLHGSVFHIARTMRFPVHGGVGVYLLRRNDSSKTSRWFTPNLDCQPTIAGWRAMQLKVEDLGVEMMALLRNARSDGKTVCGYGATAKSTVWMAHLGIGPDLIQYLVDETPQKQGSTSPCGIPVLPEKAIEQADMAVIFSHNFAKEIMAKNQNWTGRWVIPLPNFKVIEQSGLEAANKEA